MNSFEIISVLKDIIEEHTVFRTQKIAKIDFKIQKDSNDTLLFLNKTKKLDEIISKAKLESLLVTSSKIGFENEIVIKKDYFLEAQKRICDFFFPIKKKLLIGITGTNGKTTTSYYISELLSQNNVKAVAVGTNGLVLGSDLSILQNFEQTTPSYIDIRKIISDFYGNFEACVFEVSSHALDQDRFYKIKFDHIGWSSFSQDHLDYHLTMNNYFEAKMKIFKYARNQVIHLSSSENELIKKIRQRGMRVSDFEFEGDLENPVLNVEYNKKNLDLSLGILNEINPHFKFNFDLLENPEGRFQLVKKNGYEVVIDFAHTPDALERLLIEAKKVFKNKILIIFGCGGNRDASKRKMMGNVASKLSDFTIITSDNPRWENPLSIIKNIEEGFEKSLNYKVIEDRKEAIHYGILNFKNHTILIAGKGHENYIDIAGEKIPYLDYNEVIRNIQ